jgi:hypothetical protein
MFPRDFSKKWKIAYIAFLAVFGIGGVILKDYLITGYLVSSNIAFLIDPKRSKTHKAVQNALLGTGIILAGVYFYLKIKSARQ